MSIIWQNPSSNSNPEDVCPPACLSVLQLLCHQLPLKQFPVFRNGGLIFETNWFLHSAAEVNRKAAVSMLTGVAQPTLLYLTKVGIDFWGFLNWGMSITETILEYCVVQAFFYEQNFLMLCPAQASVLLTFDSFPLFCLVTDLRSAYNLVHSC